MMSIQDLSPSERRFVQAMSELQFGRFESIRIEEGEVRLDPWPVAIQDVKFANADSVQRPSERCDLKLQIVELLAYIRSVKAGDIRTLRVRHRLPFSMEISYCPEPPEGRGQGDGGEETLPLSAGTAAGGKTVRPRNSTRGW